MKPSINDIITAAKARRYNSDADSRDLGLLAEEVERLREQNQALAEASCESCREKNATISAQDAELERLHNQVQQVAALVDVGETLGFGPVAAEWRSRLVLRLRDIVGGHRR